MIHPKMGRERAFVDVRGKAVPARFPYLTIGLSAAAVAAIAAPDLGDAWQLERNAVRAGETWRVFTCHLSHWSTDHCVWDLLTFAMLGAFCEGRSRLRFAVATIAGALAISASVWFALPQVRVYRGLSGIDCALFALLAVLLIRERAGTPAAAGGTILLAAAFLKVGYEVVTGTTLFVGGTPGVTPLPLAHVSGGLAGLVVAVWPNAAAITRKSGKIGRVGVGAPSIVTRSPSLRWPRGFLE
jgi:rhomboid family GlyGly-CTERM serine protease